MSDHSYRRHSYAKVVPEPVETRVRAFQDAQKLPASNMTGQADSAQPGSHQRKGFEKPEMADAANILLLLGQEDNRLQQEREEREHRQIWEAYPLSDKRRRIDEDPGFAHEHREPMEWSQAWPAPNGHRGGGNRALVREPFTVKYDNRYDPEETEDETESER